MSQWSLAREVRVWVQGPTSEPCASPPPGLIRDPPILDQGTAIGATMPTINSGPYARVECFVHREEPPYEASLDGRSSEASRCHRAGRVMGIGETSNHPYYPVELDAQAPLLLLHEAQQHARKLQHCCGTTSSLSGARLRQYQADAEDQPHQERRFRVHLSLERQRGDPQRQQQPRQHQHDQR